MRTPDEEAVTGAADRHGGGFGWLVVGLAAVAALAGLARLPEPPAAALVVAGVATLALRAPASGLVALVLLVPFLLGEHKTAYFWLEPVLVGLVLVGALVHRGLGRLRLTPVHGLALAAFVVAAVLALPLDLRDLLEDLWVGTSLDWPLMLRQGIPDVSHLKYLDRLMVTALAAGLFVVAAQPGPGHAVVRAFPALALVVATLAAFGLLRFFGALRTAGQYLTLSFWTWQNPDLRLTAVAWNPDYFALLLVLTIPLGVALALGDERPAARRLGAAAAALGTTALVLTFQRAAYLALGVAALALVAALARARPGTIRTAPVAAAAGAGLLAVVLLDGLLLDGRVVGRLGRLLDDPNRVRLWTTALRMAADQPLLGVGTGRYAFFFAEYAGSLREGFGPFWGTAHSLYLHLLAEQGIVGLGSFAVLFVGVWWGAWRRLGTLPRGPATALAGVLAALAGWLAYGALQFTFRVNALVHLAWLLAGVAMALAPPPPPAAGRRRWLVPVLLAVAVAALGLRAGQALRRPVSPGYEGGFYRWERQADGGAARWTRRRAAMTVPVRGRVLALRFRAPIPGIEARPQLVSVWVDRRPRGVVRLASGDWQALDLPLDAPAGAHALVELEVAHTVVPARLGPSRDRRTLGVMVAEVAWRDA